MGLKKLVFVNVYVIMLHALEYDNVYGPLYGEQWMLMTDDEGYPHYVNFSRMPEESEARGRPREVYFFLFTRNNENNYEKLDIKDGTLESTNFDPESDLKVITHGWTSSADADWIHDMKSAYLRQSCTNVIAVDWSDMSKTPIYPRSAYDTRYVGKKVAEMIDAIGDSYGLNGSRVHLIGHSLGAQVMGYAGSFSKQPISRITGLDPARPLFELPNMGDEYRLDPTDADFVDIIHTCGGMLGYKRSHGHADFYPNDGQAMQPGCDGLQYVIEACSHGRSHQYFIESIESEGFVATSCENWDMYKNGSCSDNPTNLMGAPVDTTRPGNYFLYTNSETKYAKG